MNFTDRRGLQKEHAHFCNIYPTHPICNPFPVITDPFHDEGGGTDGRCLVSAPNVPSWCPNYAEAQKEIEDCKQSIRKDLSESEARIHGHITHVLSDPQSVVPKAFSVVLGLYQGYKGTYWVVAGVVAGVEGMLISGFVAAVISASATALSPLVLPAVRAMAHGMVSGAYATLEGNLIL